ncbi:hypothetical protein Droror1_Dr00008759 [Drosera rotundifolia]
MPRSFSYKNPASEGVQRKRRVAATALFIRHSSFLFNRRHCRFVAELSPSRREKEKGIDERRRRPEKSAVRRESKEETGKRRGLSAAREKEDLRKTEELEGEAEKGTHRKKEN